MLGGVKKRLVDIGEVGVYGEGVVEGFLFLGFVFVECVNRSFLAF